MKSNYGSIGVLCFSEVDFFIFPSDMPKTWKTYCSRPGRFKFLNLLAKYCSKRNFQRVVHLNY